MRISDILIENMVLANVDAPTKEEVLTNLAVHLTSHRAVEAGAESIATALINRERLGSTGVGDGVAIPHAKVPGLSELVACFARVPAGVEFDAIDQKPVKLIFVLLVPENSAGRHLKALARISRLLKDGQFRSDLLDNGNGASIYSAFVTEDAKH